ncbi:MAG: hypothetical protein NZ765_05645 [Anaerolineae bacterium]|nr:hypothetical protein [Anaerolineae bacterium]MDW8071076.1 hypothetical protein [Anaerolineae bacterium]
MLIIRPIPGCSRDNLKRLILLVAATLLIFVPRLADLGGYLIVDEADR